MSLDDPVPEDVFFGGEYLEEEYLNNQIIGNSVSLRTDGRGVDYYELTLQNALDIYTNNSENSRELEEQLQELIVFNFGIIKYLKERDIFLPTPIKERELCENSLLPVAIELLRLRKQNNSRKTFQ
jgi:hypothetical protein